MGNAFKIKCNVKADKDSPRRGYLYWSGVHWTGEIVRAAAYDTEKKAEAERARLSPPKGALPSPKGRGPEVFSL